MKLIDVHAHLDHSRFSGDLSKVLDRAEKAGVELIICSGVNPETNRRILDIAENYDIVKPSFGLYPIDALAKEFEMGEADGFLRNVDKFDIDEELDWIEKNADKCVAIGEVGLDYNWKEFQSEEMREKQKEVFRKILSLVKKLDKPVIIHSRKAELDVIEIVEEFGMEKVVLHCFNGKMSLIRRGVENGWFFSVPPVITRLQHFQTLVNIVPIEQLLTETDAPYLSPVVGERNEPENVVVTVGEIARIKGLSEDEVAEKIFDNAKRVFGFG